MTTAPSTLHNAPSAQPVAALLAEMVLQYAQRVWNINEGSNDQRIDEAIRRTREFFESLGIKTHLSDYQISPEGIDAIIRQLEAHGMTALGEHRQIGLKVSRAILTGAFA